MGRKYVKKITRSANIDSYESLAKFYERQVEFLKHERKRVIRFFNDNNIQGDNLSIKVARLQILIDEDNIKHLTKEKNDFKKQCNDLEAENNQLKQKIEEMNVDAERTERLHKQDMERARVRNNNLYEQQLAYSWQLTNQGLVRTTPVLQRTESLDLELEHRREDME
ncbi:15711_t:CDS:2, partial [Dentiscutata erythropus]